MVITKVVGDFINFNSNAKLPYNKLSNFHRCEIEFEGHLYPSVEHVFQAQKVEEKNRFAVDGDLSTFDAFRDYTKIFFPVKKGDSVEVVAENKIKYS